MLSRAFDERVPCLFLGDLGLVRARGRVVVLHDRRGAPHERDPDAWPRAWSGARDRAATRGPPEGLLGSGSARARRDRSIGPARGFGSTGRRGPGGTARRW